MGKNKEETSYNEIYPSLVSSIMDVNLFHKLRVLPIIEISKENFDLMYKVRGTVPHINSNTLIKKIVSPNLIPAYLGKDVVRNFEGVTGFIAKWIDLDPNYYLHDIIVDLALTYKKSEFFNGEIDEVADLSKREHREKMVDRIFAIKSISNRSSQNDEFFKIPFGTNLGSSNIEEIQKYLSENEPFTGNGFTSGLKTVIPEFYIRFEYDKEYAQPFNEGDEIFQITEKDIKLIAIYDTLNQKWQEV